MVNIVIWAVAASIAIQSNHIDTHTQAAGWHTWANSQSTAWEAGTYPGYPDKPRNGVSGCCRTGAVFPRRGTRGAVLGGGIRTSGENKTDLKWNVGYDNFKWPSGCCRTGKIYTRPTSRSWATQDVGDSETDSQSSLENRTAFDR